MNTGQLLNIYRLSAESPASKLAVQGPPFLDSSRLFCHSQALSRFSYALGNDRHLHYVSTIYTWMTRGKPPTDATANTAICEPHLQKVAAHWLSPFLAKLVPMLRSQIRSSLDCVTMLDTCDWHCWRDPSEEHGLASSRRFTHIITDVKGTSTPLAQAMHTQMHPLLHASSSRCTCAPGTQAQHYSSTVLRSRRKTQGYK